VISGVAQIAMVVHDLPRAVAFYRDTLGLALLFQVPGAAFFDCGGTRLMLALPDAGHPELDHAPSIVYFRVADLAATWQALKDRGARLEGEPHVVGQLADRDVWLAHFHDMEGNLHALTSEVPRGSAPRA